jgi:nucleotide-binding universal stress UspA family protein
MTSRQRLLVATDNSDGANRALETAAELAKRLHAELIIVNVEQGSLDHNLESFRFAENATVDEILDQRSAEILWRAEEKARSMGVANVRTESGLGDAVGFILSVARREAVDFIVVGRRGRGRLAGLLIGSVSQSLVCAAPCNVLVVP